MSILHVAPDPAPGQALVAAETEAVVVAALDVMAEEAAAAGKSERAIMARTGHKSLPMARTYIREGDLFRANAARPVPRERRRGPGVVGR